MGADIKELWSYRKRPYNSKKFCNKCIRS